jgi:serine/threonine protein kinase
MKTCAVCSSTFEDLVSFCPHDGEVLAEAQESLVGQVLDGQYEVEAFIAQGGMGSVYRARHILLQDRVVIKTLRPDMRNNAEWLRRFQREGRAARLFRHPNAVLVHDLRARPDGLVYLVMEYVDGRPLRNIISERGQFTPTEALELLEPIADVLDAAHAVGVVHRDLKPDNVMICAPETGPRPKVKLLDLGISKIVGSGGGLATMATALTTEGQIIGTPHYMSPEQWGELPRDGSPEVDGRTDIYSLGLIFYEMLSGSKPFSAPTLTELRHHHIKSPVKPLAELAAGMPDGFSQAVLRALSKDRNDRQATAGELVAELRFSLGLSARQGLASTATPAPETTGDRATQIIDADKLSMASPADATRDNSVARGTGVAGAPPVQPPGARPSDAPPSAFQETVTIDSLPARSGPLETVVMAPQPGQAAPEQQAAGAAVQSPPQPTPAPPSPLIGRTADAEHSFDKVTGAARPSGRRRLVLLLSLALAALLVAVVGAAAWFMLTRTQQQASEPAGNARPAEGGKAGAVAPRVEAMRYWVVAYPPTQGEGVRVAEESLSLRPGQQFQLHFVPRADGYIYVVTQEDGGPMSALITAKPVQIRSNRLEGGAELTFPPGRNVLQLSTNSGTDVLTVIYSRQPLTEPAALLKEANRTLSPEEQAEVDEFLTRHAAAVGMEASVKGTGSGDAHVSVSAVGDDAGERPVVFRVPIKHN